MPPSPAETRMHAFSSSKEHFRIFTLLRLIRILKLKRVAETMIIIRRSSVSTVWAVAEASRITRGLAECSHNKVRVAASWDELVTSTTSLPHSVACMGLPNAWRRAPPFRSSASLEVLTVFENRLVAAGNMLPGCFGSLFCRSARGSFAAAGAHNHCSAADSSQLNSGKLCLT